MLKFKTDWRPKSSVNGVLSPVLKGARITLKAPSIKDYKAWHQVRQKNKSFLKTYEPSWPKDCLSNDFFSRRLERQAQERQSGRGAFFLIHLDNQIIGGLNLNNIQMGAARHATLGYWIDEDHQGQGYMSEAINLMIDYGFNILKLRRLNAACLPDNHRSIKMLLSLGFEEEGYAKKYLQINGHWQDHRLFGLVTPLSATANA